MALYSETGNKWLHAHRSSLTLVAISNSNVIMVSSASLDHLWVVQITVQMER